MLPIMSTIRGSSPNVDFSHASSLISNCSAELPTALPLNLTGSDVIRFVLTFAISTVLITLSVVVVVLSKCKVSTSKIIASVAFVFVSNATCELLFGTPKFLPLRVKFVLSPSKI